MRRTAVIAIAAAAMVFVLGMAAGRIAATPAPAVDLGRAPDFALLDADGRHHQLSRYADSRGVVLFVYGEGCTIARDSLPALRQLRDELTVADSRFLQRYRRQPADPAAGLLARGTQRVAHRLDHALTWAAQHQRAERQIAFLMIDAGTADAAALRAHASSLSIDFPILRDETQLVARSLGISRTAEALLIDTRTWKIVYRGPVDDRLHFDARRAEARTHYLRDAIAALIDGRPVPQSPEPDLGCAVASAPAAAPSYERDVAPLLAQKCVTCHQQGGVAPWAMDGYPAVKTWAAMIREVVKDRRMPPWHADPSIGHFANDASLTPRQIRMLTDWIDAGAPRGQGADPLAQVRTPAAEWPLGTPDLVVGVPAQRIPATGVLDYRYVTVPITLERDSWVRAVHLQPGNRNVVHHAFAFLKPPPGAGQADYKEGINGFFAAYVPGQDVVPFPHGSGQLLPRGTQIEFQLHYTPNGAEAIDESRLALYFHAHPPEHELRVASAANTRFRIPPLVDEHPVEAVHALPQEALLHALFPHMHLRGRSFAYQARYPDGRSEMLLSVPRYRFGWQGLYVLAQAKAMPAGTEIVARGTFDNSRLNPANPDPAKAVYFGRQTDEEMFLGYLMYTVPRERRGAPR